MFLASCVQSRFRQIRQCVQYINECTPFVCVCLCFEFSSNSKNAPHFSQRKNQTRTPSPTPYTLPEHYYIVNATARPSLEYIAAERERIRMEFYATYDVMTGVRIAATLGGFFGLMVFLVIYKSRGETHETMKALKVGAADSVVGR